MQIKIRAAAALALLAITTAATAVQFGDYRTTGFLSDYSKLRHQPGTDAYSWSDQTADLGKYDKVIIDRIKIYLKDDAKSQEIDPTDLKALADYFHDAIVKQMAGAYQVVRAPGPDVLRLRVAVTDLVPNKAEASVITLAIPFGGVAEAGVGALQGKPGSSPFVGEATVEMEALDSESSRQVGAYIETRAAKKIDVDLGHGVGTAVNKGVGGFVGSFSTWAYTEKAMDHWAELIRAWLDAAPRDRR